MRLGLGGGAPPWNSKTWNKGDLINSGKVFLDQIGCLQLYRIILVVLNFFEEIDPVLV